MTRFNAPDRLLFRQEAALPSHSSRHFRNRPHSGSIPLTRRTVSGYKPFLMVVPSCLSTHPHTDLARMLVYLPGKRTATQYDIMEYAHR